MCCGAGSCGASRCIRPSGGASKNAAPIPQNWTSVLRQASIVLAMRLHPSYSADAHSKKSEGARDAARSNRSAGVEAMAMQMRSLDLNRRPKEKTSKSAFSPASRARCLRLCSARPPVAEVSNHRFGPGQRLAVWHGVTALPPKSPVTPSVAPGRCSFSRRALGGVLHPCAATALRSRLTTPREALSDGPAWAQYESGKSARG